MIIRTLAADEFPRMKTFHDGKAPDPRMGTVIVAEEDGQIYGRIFLVAPLHIEGPYVMPDKRGGLLATRLVDKAAEEAGARKVESLFAFGFTPELEGYLQRLGFEQRPITVWERKL